MTVLTDVTSLDVTSPLCLWGDETIGTIPVEYRGRPGTPARTNTLRPPSTIASDSAYSPCLREAMQVLSQLELLEPNWDSYGADPVAPVAIAAARSLLFRLFERAGEQAKPAMVAPLNNGGVQMEWRGTEREIEVEISPDRKYGYLLIKGSGSRRVFVESDDVDLAAVLHQLDRVLGA